MKKSSIAFSMVSLVAGAVGFFGISNVASHYAKMLSFLFLILFVSSLIIGHRKGIGLQNSFSEKPPT